MRVERERGVRGVRRLRAGLAGLPTGWLLAGWLLAGPAAAQTPAAPGAATGPSVAQRLAVCAACHGPDGNATLALSPSLAGQPKVFLENQLIVIREGLREIAPMKGLLDGVSDADVVAMAQHFTSLPPKAQPAPRRADAFARGQALAARTQCGSCHLPSYVGQQQMPRLAGQREDYLLHSMRQFRDGQAVGRDSIMASSLYGLKDNDLTDLAHFLAQLQ